MRHRRRKWIRGALHVSRRRRSLRASGYTPRLHRHRQHRKKYRVEPAHKGALHRQLGIPAGEKIPLSMLKWAARQPGKLGKRARFALNVRGLRHRKRKRR